MRAKIFKPQNKIYKIAYQYIKCCHLFVAGLLRDEIEKDAEKAFQSYMGIVASPPNNTDDFAMKVNEYMQQPPFSFPNPVKGLGGIKKVKLCK